MFSKKKKNVMMKCLLFFDIFDTLCFIFCFFSSEYLSAEWCYLSCVSLVGQWRGPMDFN